MPSGFVTEFLAQAALRGFESSNIYDDRAALWQFEDVLDEESLDEGGDENVARGFTCFSRLARELREMIWKAALPGPRFILLRHTTTPHLYSSSPLLSYKPADHHYFFSSSPVPSLLHTCSESRRIMQASGWELAFPSQNENSAGPPTVWFNFSIDVLYWPHYFRSRDDFPNTNDQVYLQCKVKKVAVKLGDYHGRDMHVLSRWKNMEDLFITLDPAPRMMSWRDRERMRPHLNPFLSICRSWEPEPVPLPWHKRLKACWDRKRQMAKERREEPKLRAVRSTGADKERQRWRFLDADGEDVRGFEGISLDDYFTPSDEGQILTRDVFARMKSMVEVRSRDVEEALGTLPNVRIGVLVPENKAPALARKRDEII